MNLDSVPVAIESLRNGESYIVYAPAGLTKVIRSNLCAGFLAGQDFYTFRNGELPNTQTIFTRTYLTLRETLSIIIAGVYISMSYEDLDSLWSANFYEDLRQIPSKIDLRDVVGTWDEGVIINTFNLWVANAANEDLLRRVKEEIDPRGITQPDIQRLRIYVYNLQLAYRRLEFMDISKTNLTPTTRSIRLQNIKSGIEALSEVLSDAEINLEQCIQKRELAHSIVARFSKKIDAQMPKSSTHNLWLEIINDLSVIKMSLTQEGFSINWGTVNAVYSDKIQLAPPQ